MLAAALVFASTISPAIEAAADNSLPFTYAVERVEQMEMKTGVFTVAVIMLKNGPHFLERVSIDCIAANKDGYTWLLRGVALDLQKDTSRTFRITNYLPPEPASPWRDASKVSCRVRQYETGL